jgi:hypothetical protein
MRALTDVVRAQTSVFLPQIELRDLGTIGTQGTIVAYNMTWMGGTLNNTGTTYVPFGYKMRLITPSLKWLTNQHRIYNNGTVEWNGGWLAWNQGAIFDNYGNFDITVKQGFLQHWTRNNPSATVAFFNNFLGANITKSTRGRVAFQAYLSNSGNVQVNGDRYPLVGVAGSIADPVVSWIQTTDACAGMLQSAWYPRIWYVRSTTTSVATTDGRCPSNMRPISSQEADAIFSFNNLDANPWLSGSIYNNVNWYATRCGGAISSLNWRYTDTGPCDCAARL